LRQTGNIAARIFLITGSFSLSDLIFELIGNDSQYMKKDSGSGQPKSQGILFLLSQPLSFDEQSPFLRLPESPLRALLFVKKQRFPIVQMAGCAESIAVLQKARNPQSGRDTAKSGSKYFFFHH